MSARHQAIKDFMTFLKKDETGRAKGISKPTPEEPLNGAAEQEGPNPDPFDDDQMEALEELLGRK